MGKIAACYTLFNGSELLKGSVEQMILNTDVFIFCYQMISNRGEEVKHSDMIKIYEAKEMLEMFYGAKVSMIEFEPDLTKSTKENERRKHQMMINTCKDLGVDYFILLAADEYYDPSEFSKAFDYIVENNIDASASKMWTFYKKPTWRLERPEPYYKPFICKLYDHTRIDQKAWPVHTDPSVRVFPFEKFYEFPEDQLMMWHFSMIRRDIENKFRNAAASVNWEANEYLEEFLTYDIKENKGVKYFGGMKIKEVENQFNIEI